MEIRVVIGGAHTIDLAIVNVTFPETSLIGMKQLFSADKIRLYFIYCGCGLISCSVSKNRFGLPSE